MSPVSRGRKKKQEKRRQRPLGPVSGQPEPDCDCPACRADEFGPGPAGAMDAMLADASLLLTQDDPLDAEVSGAVLSSVVAVAMTELGAAAGDADRVLTSGLVPEFEARASTEAMAVLLGLAAVAPDPLAGEVRSATARMARAGVECPRWADELTAPLAVGECWQLRDPMGTGSVLGASFVRAGRSHALLVFVDALDCGAASDIVVLDGDELPEVREQLRAGESPEGVPPAEEVSPQVEVLDPAEWRWLVENALDAREVHDRDDAILLGPDDALQGDPDADDEAMYPALAALLRARLAHLPVSDKPRPPHGGHDDEPGFDFAAVTAELARLGAGRGRGGPRARAGGAKLPAKSTKKHGPAAIYQVKVGLRGAKPPIWRRLQLPGDTSLAAVHRVIQVAFGWEDYHMHVFSTPYGEFGVADRQLGHRAEAPVTLEQVAPAAGAKIGYTYDFGDNWTLDIEVEKLLDAEPDVGYPRCTGGRRAAPPEDCGGVWGYADLVEVMSDRGHPEREERLEWLGLTDGAEFDPARFDADEITRALVELR